MSRTFGRRASPLGSRSPDEVVEARGGYSSLNLRLNAMEAGESGLLVGLMADNDAEVDPLDGRITISGGAGIDAVAGLSEIIITLETPGTLSVSTLNDPSGEHTHAIRTSSNPGPNRAILATTPAGHLTLESLTAGGLTFVDDVISASNGTVIIGDGMDLGIDGYVSQSIGWQIDNEGNADFRTIFAGALEVQTFISHLEQALAGSLTLTKSVAVLGQDYEVRATGLSSPIIVEDIPGAPGTPIFDSGDWVRMRVIDRSGGGLLVENVWGTVSGYVDLGNGAQQWTYTVQDDGGAAGSTVYAQATILDYGTSGAGYWRATALDEDGPYSEIQTWTIDPTNPLNHTLRTRMGNLDGVIDAGLKPEGFGFYSDNVFLRGKLWVSGNEIRIDDEGIRIVVPQKTSFAPQRTYGFTDGVALRAWMGAYNLWDINQDFEIWFDPPPGDFAGGNNLARFTIGVRNNSANNPEDATARIVLSGRVAETSGSGSRSISLQGPVGISPNLRVNGWVDIVYHGPTVSSLLTIQRTLDSPAAANVPVDFIGPTGAHIYYGLASNGNFGIHNSDSLQDAGFQVDPATGNLYLDNGSAGVLIRLTDRSDNDYWEFNFWRTGDQFRLLDNGSPRMLWNKGGDIAIPGQLIIGASAAATFDLEVIGESYMRSGNPQLRLQHSTGSRLMGIRAYNDGTNERMIFYTSLSGTITLPVSIYDDCSSNTLVLRNNAVGIHTNNPQYYFDANANTAGYMSRFWNDGNNNNRHGIQIWAGTDTNPQNSMLGFASGNGSGVGFIGGDGAGGVNYNTSSDERGKDDIQDLERGLEIARALRPVSYRGKRPQEGKGPTAERTERRTIGLLAQQVQAVAPEVVSEAPDGTLAMDYGRLTPILLKAIQELAERVEDLEGLVSA